MNRPRRVILLGSTGSIGTQTIEVVEHLAARARAEGQHPPLEIVALAAGRNAPLLAQQAQRLGVRHIALADESARDTLHAHASAGGPRVLCCGPSAAEELVRTVDADLVVAAMVGAAGLPATLAAVQLGRDVALANKETLVAAGALIVPAARASGARLLPVDSEHAAVWQCLQRAGPAAAPPLACGPEIARVVLTASGGALRTLSREQAYAATPAQALKHPTWSMGAKVTLDSASLTNKAFEVIEAHWLFGLEAERIGVLVHPQSIVHALVEFADGNVIAHLGSPDMRAPIQYALEFPDRTAGVARKMDWSGLRALDFAEPSLDRFPALGLAYRVIRAGGLSGAVFNAASEEATLAFLASHEPAPALAAAHGPSRGDAPIPFGRVVDLAAEALDAVEGADGRLPARSLQDVLDADARARAFVRARLER